MNIGLEQTITIIISIITSSAIVGFVQFLIKRHDEKSERHDSIIGKIATLKQTVDALFRRFDKYEAVSARIRILTAADEIRAKQKHSEEFFNQISDDITLYNNYCREHEEFVNNRAHTAIKVINDAYQKALRDNDFL